MPVTYDYVVLVIGAGHAGVEAALAAARLGAEVALLTASLDTVGVMSCNPAIGGVAKGQIVREVDALGGAMGQVIDQTGIQFRLLNRRKGPAMHSPRAQADKKAYQQLMKFRVEQQENLTLRQEAVEDLIVEVDVVRGQSSVRTISRSQSAQYGVPTVARVSAFVQPSSPHSGHSQSVVLSPPAFSSSASRRAAASTLARSSKLKRVRESSR